MKSIGKWLVGIYLSWFALSVQAFDIGLILNAQQAKSLQTDPLEKVVEIYPDSNNTYALTRFGHRLYFFSRFEKGQRVWRSVPLTGINEDCVRIEQHGKSTPIFWIRGDQCPAPAKPQAAWQWYIEATGTQLSQTTNDPTHVILWHQVDEATTSQLLSTVQTHQSLPIAPSLQQTPTLPTLADFQSTVAQALADPPHETSALLSLLNQYDWPHQPIKVVDLNNAGYLLANSNNCHQLEDSLALLQHVQIQAPSRAVTYLNLADTLNRYSQQQCAGKGQRVLHDTIPGFNPRAITELYRQYCTLTGPANIPPTTAKRIAALIGTKQLTTEACHPHYALFRAVEAKDLTALEAALADPANNMDEFGPSSYTALHTAIESGWSEGAMRLIAAGARISPAGESDYTPSNLVSAIYRRDLPVIDSLLAAGASITDYGEHATQPLHTVARLHSRSAADEAFRQQVLRRLLAKDPSAIRSLDNEGQSVLHAAVDGYVPPETLEILLATGIYIHQTDKYGRNAAFMLGPFAAEKPQAIQTLQWLISHGINLQQQDRSGDTVLNHLFAYSRSDSDTLAALANLILAQGASPYIGNQENRNPIFYAALRPMPTLLAKLLEVPVPANTNLAWVPDLKARIQRQITERMAQKSSSDCDCLKDYQTVATLLDQHFPTK